MDIARLTASVLALGAILASNGAARAGTDADRSPIAPVAAPIGVATLSEDFVLTLRLRAEGAGGTIGDGVLTYAPGDPMYEKVMRHIGGIKPGEPKPVPPWP